VYDVPKVTSVGFIKQLFENEGNMKKMEANSDDQSRIFIMENNSRCKREKLNMKYVKYYLKSPHTKKQH